jgi:hypothetical protein
MKRPGARWHFTRRGPSDAEVATALATIRHRVQRLLVRHGLEPAGEATGRRIGSPRSPRSWRGSWAPQCSGDRGAADAVMPAR